MDERQGRLAHDQNQPPPLFEHDVGRPFDERLRHARSDPAGRTDRTRHDDHRIVARRTAGRRGEQVAIVVTDELRVVGQCDAFVRHDRRRDVAVNECYGFHAVECGEALGGLAGVDGAAGGGNGKDQFHRRRQN